jgi:predicted 2-oxoglutarate/Fe(II)-dependent dioxygenase YbiX/peroxiredoxin
MPPPANIAQTRESAPPTRKTRRYVHLQAGDPVPWFSQRSSCRDSFAFDTAAGRYLVLCFYAFGSDDRGRAALASVEQHRALFDDGRFSFFGVSIDMSDASSGRVKGSLPGVRHFWDWDRSVSKLYGSLPVDARPGDGSQVRRFWMVVDPMLRAMAAFPLDQHEAVFKYLENLPPPGLHIGFQVQAPVLVLPRVFEPEFCRALIDLYERHGGEESGFMRQVGDKTVGVHDHSHKRRKDCMIEDPQVIRAVQNRIARRVYPELLKSYSFQATRMERYLVGCYSAEDGGHFRPHRDNTTLATAHRRFAVSINLNGDFEGGEVSFPEFNRKGFKVPPGTALIFPGAILHAVGKVTKGRRYAFLPFVYDEAAARVREANRKFLDTSTTV